MIDTPVHLGQSRVVGFFVICCVLAAMGMIRGLTLGGQVNPVFVAAQLLFIILAGTAAWFLYASESVGWYLSLLAAANWFTVLITETIHSGFYAVFLSVGMLAVLVWLFRRSVMDHFKIKLLT